MRRALLVLWAILLGCCIGRPTLVATDPQIIWIPVLAQDTDQVCLSLSSYPQERCVSVREIRMFILTAKAD